VSRATANPEEAVGKTLLGAAPNVVRAHAAMAGRESFKATAPKVG
jgi:hypothetical protein